MMTMGGFLLMKWGGGSACFISYQTARIWTCTGYAKSMTMERPESWFTDILYTRHIHNFYFNPQKCMLPNTSNTFSWSLVAWVLISRQSITKSTNPSRLFLCGPIKSKSKQLHLTLETTSRMNKPRYRVNHIWKPCLGTGT